MTKLYVGKIVSTHGIKGELKIISDTNYKDKVFRVGNNIIIEDELYQIERYRVHKKYDLVTLKGYEDINLIDKLLQKDVFINKEEIKLDDKEYLYIELIDLKIVDKGKVMGRVLEIRKGVKYNYLVIESEKNFLIPLLDIYIKEVDLKNKKIITANVKDLIF